MFKNHLSKQIKSSFTTDENRIELKAENSKTQKCLKYYLNFIKVNNCNDHFDILKYNFVTIIPSESLRE